ncbi:hypothetical protein NIES4102_06050 [Chondrocystis sp. NIES-4102]|nr:hypothetical protein NIES4102_06050 [Chondrocystis sp. NIES-4102]
MGWQEFDSRLFTVKSIAEPQLGKCDRRINKIIK